MVKFKLYPIINGTADFYDDAQMIESFTIVNSIEDGLPFGYMDITDAESRMLNAFNSLQVGASLNIKALYDENNPQSDDIKKLEITDWVILYVEPYSTEGKSAVLRVYFGHKMFLYKDMKNHCFEPQTNDKIIKRVLEDQTRGCKFELDEFDTPDNVPIKRYKVQESDWEFLQNKVVAYSSYKKTPMYLYSNLNNKFYFKSTSSMFSKNPEIGLYFLSDNGDSQAFEDFIQMYSLKKQELIKDWSISIGNKDAVSEMNRQFALFDNQTGMTFTGIKGPTAKIENDSSSLAKYYPIDYLFQSTSSCGSSIAKLNNHQIDDLYNLLNRSLKDFDGMFTLKIKTDFNSALLNIGACVAIFFGENHWANGKWILKDSKIALDRNGNSAIGITLCRPTFSGNKLKTTLENYGSMFTA